ncbi:MAG: acyltransferase [Deltaproteobacteria bacterium]|nr:acyltransferase [Deltaproteobacteria bacterium]
MPLPPLPDPASRSARLAGLGKAIPATAILFSTLLGLNLLQTLSLLVKPFSGRVFRAFNRWAANSWWGLCVIGARSMHGVRVELSGDDVPMRENAIVVANHQQMPDITFMMDWARQKDRLGDMKWMVKDIIKWVPGIGWGMAFLDCVFVKRDWAADRASIERTFSRLIRNDVPMWLLSFPEGTRVSPAKLAGSREYAATEGLAPPEHVLVPRTKGFVASVVGLRRHARAVYDVTIAYERGVPTLWQYVKGFARVAHLHVRRFPTADLPEGDEELARWLLARFQEKDRLLDHFYRHGSFPATA